MTRREMILAGGGAVTVLLFWMLVIAPLRADVRRLDASMPELRAEAEEMARLAQHYEQMQLDERTLRQWLGSRQPDFALFPYVTETARQQGLALASLQPSARTLGDGWQVESVEVALDNVRLPALVAFLEALTQPGNVVRIDRFTLRGDAQGLSVRFEAQTLSRAT